MTDPIEGAGTSLVEAPAVRGTISAMAMVPRGAGGGVVLLPTTFAEVIAVAQMMAQASHAVPKHLRGNPGACMAVVLRASNWEMDPFAVATKTYAVNDILAYESQLVSAVVNMRAPVKGRPKIVYEGEGGELRCTFSYTMLDGDVLEYRSPKVKDIKVKNSPLWVGDPEQQLFYFSARAWARRWVPEVLMGVYTPDEVIEQVAEGEVRATSFEALEARAAAAAEAPAPAVVLEEKEAARQPEKSAPAKPAVTRGAKAAAAETASDASTATEPGTAATGGDTGEASTGTLDTQVTARDPGAEVPDEEQQIPPFLARLCEDDGVHGQQKAVQALDAPAAAEGSTDPSTALEAAPGPADSAFADYASAIAGANDWPQIRLALAELLKTDEWRAADVRTQSAARAIGYTRLKELVGAGYGFDIITDLHAYRCYIEWETDTDALIGIQRTVGNTKLWLGLSTEAKVMFDKAHFARLEVLKQAPDATAQEFG